MATFSVQHIAVWAALGTMLAHSEERLDSRITILVYDYAGVQADTLLKAEQETSRIFRHSGVDITWRPCHMLDSTVPLECPEPGPMTPALRLVPRFQPVADRVHSEAMGFSTGAFATVSVESAQTLEESGVAQLPQILGHIIAHEIGHVLLPGKGHSVSGTMRAHWGSNEWRLVREGELNFVPEQSGFLRAELLLNHSITKLTGAEQINVLTCNMAHVSDTAITSAKADATRLFLDIGVNIVWFDCGDQSRTGDTAPLFILRIRDRAPAGLPKTSASEIMGKAYIAPDAPRVYADIFCESVQGFAHPYGAGMDDALGYAIAHELGHLLLGTRHTAKGLISGNWGVDELRAMRQHALKFGTAERISIRHELQGRNAQTTLANPNESSQ